MPRSPYQGEPPTDASSKDYALKGAVGQAPAEAQIPAYTRHIVAPKPTPTPESDESDKKEYVSQEEEEAEKEKVRAEKFKQKEEEKKKLFDATKISKNVAFSVPADIKYDPEGPRPDQIVLLCASDGKGHNGGIENLLEQARENRQEYADFHGYKYHFLNISKFDIAPAHPVWGKLPAIAETFETYPDAQWIWWLDLDAILMTPSVDLNELLLSHKALGEQLHKDQVLTNSGGGKSNISTPKNPDVKKIDLIFSQDQNGINAGSFFIRRSEWSRTFLDVWADPLFVMRTWPGQEQDAVVSISTSRRKMLEDLDSHDRADSFGHETPHCDGALWPRRPARAQRLPHRHQKHGLAEGRPCRASCRLLGRG